MIRKDLTGNKYGKLTVLGFHHADKASYWNVLCECGKTNVVRGNSLTSGHAKSCGCMIGGKIDPQVKRMNVKYADYVRSAARRGYIFEISRERFEEIVSNPCAYCGTTTKIGVDRINNTLGYVEGNVAPCCSICNRAKDLMTREEFLAWIERVYEHNKHS